MSNFRTQCMFLWLNRSSLNELCTLAGSLFFLLCHHYHPPSPSLSLCLLIAAALGGNFARSSRRQLMGRNLRPTISLIGVYGSQCLGNFIVAIYCNWICHTAYAGSSNFLTLKSKGSLLWVRIVWKELSAWIKVPAASDSLSRQQLPDSAATAAMTYETVVTNASDYRKKAGMCKREEAKWLHVRA